MVDGWLWLKLPVGVSALGHKGVNDAVSSATKAFGDEVFSWAGNGSFVFWLIGHHVR